MDGQIERRGQDLQRRAERLRISAKELSKLARVSRQSTSNALAGRSVQPVTMERLEATLDRLEAEILGERVDEPTVTTIRLPDGTEVTFKGWDGGGCGRVCATIPRGAARSVGAT